MILNKKSFILNRSSGFIFSEVLSTHREKKTLRYFYHCSRHVFEPVQGTEWVVNEVVHSEEAMQRIKVTMRLERTSRVYRYVCVIPTLVAMVTLLCGECYNLL